jgi:hypothetical protein
MQCSQWIYTDNDQPDRGPSLSDVFAHLKYCVYLNTHKNTSHNFRELILLHEFPDSKTIDIQRGNCTEESWYSIQAFYFINYFSFILCTCSCSLFIFFYCISIGLVNAAGVDIFEMRIRNLF